MKRFSLSFFLIVSLLVVKAQTQQSVSIGDTQLKQNAVLYLKGNGSQGLIIPIVSSLGNFGEAGMIAYSNGTVNVHDGSNWVALGTGAGTGGGSSYSLSFTGNSLVLLKDGVAQNTLKIANNTPSANSLLMWDGAAWTSVQLSGDVSNSSGTTSVNGIKGKTIPALPSTTQALVYNGTAWVFQPLTGGSDSQDLSLTGTTLSLTNDATPVTLGTLSTLNSVSSAQITDASIASADLATGAVTSTTIADGTIAAADLSSMGATNGQILQFNAGAWAPSTVGGSGTVTNITTGTGLTGGPITSTGTVSLANTAVIPNTYGSTTAVPQITVDAQGRITSATNLAITPTVADGSITGGTAGAGVKLAANTITDANINSTANIAASKLASAVVLDTEAPNVAGDISGDFSTGLQIKTGTIAGTDLASNIGFTTSGAISTSGNFTASGPTVTIKGATWPASNVAGALVNDGVGNLSWAASGAPNLNALTDVTVSAPIDAQILIKNGAGDFTNRSVSGDIALTNTGATSISNTGATGTNIINAINNGGTTGAIIPAHIGSFDASKITSGALGVTVGGTGSTATPANGQLLIGNGTSYSVANLTTGTGLTVTPGAGTLSLSTSGNFGSQNLSTTGTLSSGVITTSGININVSYTWPSSNASGVLTNNGAGVLSWGTGASAWSLTGNGGTSPTTNFIGTTDPQDLVFKTAAAEKMRIMSGGNVGIGLTSPQSLLHLHGATNGTLRITNSNSGTTTGDGLELEVQSSGTSSIFSREPGVMTIGTGSNGVLFLTAGGFAGINNNSPSQALDVAGNVQFSGALMPASVPGAPGQVLTSQGANNPPKWINSSSSFSTLNTIPKGDGTSLVASQVFDDGTNVGIGTTTPAQKLDVTGYVRIAAGSGATNEGILLATPSPGFSSIIAGGRATNQFQISQPNNAPMTFLVNSAERLRIDGAGNIGIGTNTPHAPLQFSSTLANRKIVLNELANNDHQFFGFGVNNGELRYQVPAGTNDHVFYSGANSTLSSELARISVGNGNGYFRVGGRTPTTPLVSTSLFDITTDAGSGPSGMNINVDDGDGQPYYGYMINGAQQGSNYLDGTTNEWRVRIGGSDLLTVKPSGTVTANTVDVKTGVNIGSSTGEITHFNSGVSNNMLAIAYAVVSSTGGLNRGSSNMTASHPGLGNYDITVTGEDFSGYTGIGSGHIVVGSIMGSNGEISFTWVGPSNNVLRVQTYNSTGGAADKSFNIVIYRQ